jgi:hypothetical protein
MPIFLEVYFYVCFEGGLRNYKRNPEVIGLDLELQDFKQDFWLLNCIEFLDAGISNACQCYGVNIALAMKIINYIRQTCRNVS